MIYFMLVVVFIGQNYGQVRVEHLKSYNSESKCHAAMQESSEPPRGAFLRCVPLKDIGIHI
jgi:hypothetical protein